MALENAILMLAKSQARSRGYPLHFSLLFLKNDFVRKGLKGYSHIVDQLLECEANADLDVVFSSEWGDNDFRLAGQTWWY
jgi:hypothetical protein